MGTVADTGNVGNEKEPQPPGYILKFFNMKATAAKGFSKIRPEDLAPVVSDQLDDLVKRLVEDHCQRRWEAAPTVWLCDECHSPCTE